MNSIFKEFENLSVEKKTLSTALGFEPKSFDCRSTALSDACVAQWLEQSTGNRKTWARIPVQSKSSFFLQKYFQILYMFTINQGRI